MLKGMFKTIVCIFCSIMAVSYLPINWKVSVCLLIAVIINTNGLISKVVKWIMPWKIQVILTVILILTAIAIAPRSEEYKNHTSKLESHIKVVSTMKQTRYITVFNTQEICYDI